MIDSDADRSHKSRKAVVASELAWHEQEAHRRYSLDTLLYAPPAFDPVLLSGVRFLNPVTGERVLDMGCGEGKETLELASLGLLVVSTDLSHVQLSRARQLAQGHCPHANVCFVQANAEELPFASGQFRIIYGKAILHHLDLDISAKVVNRLLQPGGRATFAEPMASHPLFRLARRLTPRLRTQDEHPVELSDLQHYSTFFRRAEIEVYFLLTPLTYFVRMAPGAESIFRWVHSVFRRLDDRLFRILPQLRRFAWYGLVKLER
jgi:ubiquinone/menaquinone biosynthesis C-methylase UbiE